MATSTGDLVSQYLREAKRIEEMRREKKRFRNVEAFPFWPHEAIRSTVIVLAFSAAVLYISALMPYFLEAPANPAGQPEVILPDWYLLWSYGLLKPGLANALTFGEEAISVPILGALNAKTMGILLNMIIMLPLIAAPFVSTGKARRPQEAPWTAAFGVAGIVYVFNISIYSVNNVVYTEIPWWGLGLHALPIDVGGPGMMALLVFGFWAVSLPIVSFVVRRYVLGESFRTAALVAGLSVFILGSILAYGAHLDPMRLIADPMVFVFDSLKGTNMLAWMVWWTTLLSFEVAYWALVAWRQYSVRKDTYEYGLNLTYYKVR